MGIDYAIHVISLEPGYAMNRSPWRVLLSGEGALIFAVTNYCGASWGGIWKGIIRGILPFLSRRERDEPGRHRNIVGGSRPAAPAEHDERNSEALDHALLGMSGFRSDPVGNEPYERVKKG